MGRYKITSIWNVFALTQDKKTFKIRSDGNHIIPPCSLYLIGVKYINSSYSLSGMCFKISSIGLPCGRNDTLIIRGWSLDIHHKDQSILLYANQSMVGKCYMFVSNLYIMYNKIRILNDCCRAALICYSFRFCF